MKDVSWDSEIGEPVSPMNALKIKMITSPTTNVWDTIARNIHQWIPWNWWGEWVNHISWHDNKSHLYHRLMISVAINRFSYRKSHKWYLSYPRFTFIWMISCWLQITKHILSIWILVYGYIFSHTIWTMIWSPNFK